MTSPGFAQSFNNMTFLTITRRCNDCDETRRLLKALQEDVEAYRREVKDSLLDYENLYDKVRTNLSKIARREKASESPQTDERVKPKGGVAAQRLLALRRQS